MKKIVVLFFISILIIGHQNIIFASYINKRNTNEEMKLYLQEVFDNRINIWNNLMMERTSLEDIEKQLKEYTTEPLLTVDMEMFKDIIINPTSYESIREVHIQNCEAMKITEEERVFIVDILWVLQNYEELAYEEVEYIVKMEKEGNKWLLSDYQLNR